MSLYGRIQAAEAALSLAVVTEPEQAWWAAQHIEPDQFACPTFRAVWAAGVALLAEGRNPSFAEVSARAGVDEAEWRSLAARIPSTPVRDAAALVGRSSALRRLSAVLVDALAALDHAPPDEIAARVVRQLA